MKRAIIIFSIILSGVITLQSCSDFLDVKPRNTKIVKTIKDYRDILASYMDWLKGINKKGYTVMGKYYNWPHFDQAQDLAFYTGEVEFRPDKLIDVNTGAMLPYAKTILSWTKVKTITWTRNYTFLGQINFIIEEIDNAQTEESVSNNIEQEDIRRYVKGEALVWRAYTYFKTLQYYSPYKDNKLGIPIHTKAYKDPVHTLIKRSTQKEVFNQILSDCDEALELLKKTPKNSWNFAYNKPFIYAMLTNIYMYKAMSGAQEESDWTNAIEYADKAMAGRSLTNTPETLKEMFNINSETGFNDIKTDEVFVRIIKKHSFRFPENSGYTGSDFALGSAIDFIYNSYKDDDIRKSVYFKNLATNTINDKYNLYHSSGYYGGVFIPFRLADVYLIKAEALVRENKTDLAKDVLDEFKQSRYTNPVPSPGSKDELLEEILNERKLEFYHENDKRWIDMKRLGLKYNRGKIADIDFILEPYDFRYTFPIPKSDLKEGSTLKQNPGWESIIN